MKITCVFILLFLFHLNINAQSDCPDAIIVCGDANYFDLEAEGIGHTPEISPNNACASGENNTIWLKIQINQGGTLGFILTPTEDNMVIDFDFWLFGPIEECGLIGTAIRCSTTNPLQANLDYITTGMNETETDVSEGPGPDGNGFVQWITVQDNEFYYLVIDRPHGFGNFSIEWIGTATFYAVPQFLNPNNIPLDIIQCDKDGVNDQSTTFDLTVYEDMFIGTQSPVEITYHENLNDATIGEDPIALPEAYPNTSNPQTIYLRMTNTVTGCYSTETFTLNITPPMIAGQPLNMELCDDNKNGIQTFDLSSNDAAVINDNPESFVTYHTSLKDARDGVNAVGPLFENEAPIQTIWARLENAEGCYSYDFNFFTISVLPLPVFNNPGNVTLDMHICENGQDDHTAVFDLTLYKDILIDDQLNVILTYHENNDDANAGNNEIQSPTIYTNTASPQTIYMRLANIETGCFDILPFDITVYDIKAGEPENMTYCDLDDDGLNEFDLALNDDNVKNGNTDSDVTYYKSFDDAVSRQNPIGPLYQTTIPYSTETLWARLERTTPVCVVYDIKSFTISVKPLPVFNNPDNIPFDLYKCDTDGIDDQSTSFDLRVHAGIMIGTQNNIAITYYEDITDAETDDNRIAAPNSYPNISNPQTIYVRLTNTVTGCFRITNFELHILPAPQAYILPALQVCDDNNDGTAFFDLDPIIQSIQNTISNTIVTIHETPEDAIFRQNIITDTNAYPNNELNTQTLYIRVESTLTHCFDTTTLQLIVNPLPEAITPKSYVLCDDGNSDTDGKAVFNLTSKVAEVLGTLNPALYSVSYYLNLADANAGAPVIGNPVSYLSESGEVFIKVTNNTTGCYDIVKLELIVNSLPTAVQPTVALTLCDVTAPLMDGIEIFDLTSVIPSIIGTQQGINVTFHHSYADAQGNTGAIAAPNAYPSGPAVETVFVRVTVEGTGCYRIVLQDLKVEPLPIILKPTQDMLTVCDTDGNGIGEFNLSDLIEGMKNGEPFIDITFHHTLQDAQDGNNAIGNTTQYINADPYLEFVYVRVINTKTGCSNAYQLILIVAPAPQAPALGPLTLCDEDTNNQDLKTIFNLTQQDAVIYAALNAAPGSLTIHYFITEAAARAGAPRITTSANYFGSDAQVIWVRVQGANGCFSVTSFVLKVNKPLLLTTPSMLTVCNETLPNDGQAVFDLTTKNNEILGPLGVGKGYTVAYYETNPKTNPLAVAIAAPTAYTNPAPPAGNPKTLYVMVTSKEGCKSYTTLTVKVLPLPMPDTTPDDLVLCDDNNSPDGIEVFNLKLAEADIRNNDNQSDVSYYTTLADAEAGTNAIPDPTAHPSATGSVWVRMQANTNNPADPKCYQVVELKLIVNPLPAIGDANGNVPPYAICEPNTNGFAQFDLNSHIEKILGTNSVADYTIEFYFDQAALTAGTALPREYTNVVANSQTILVSVTNIATGCSITKPLQLLVEESAIANPIVITKTPLFHCDDDGNNDGFHEFDLTLVEAEVLGIQNPNQYKITYHLSEEDANSDLSQQGINPITSPTTFINTVAGGQTIWVRVTNMGTVSKCHDITSYEIIVELLPEPIVQGGTICIDKLTDSPLSPYIIDTGLDATHTFVWSDEKGVIPGETNPSLIVTKAGKYSVVATSATGCASAPIAPVEVIQSGPAVKVGVGYYVSNAFSDNQTITVDVDGYGVYQYKLDEGSWQDSPQFTNVSPGEHTITVRDIKTDNPCEDLVIIGANIIDYPNFFTPNGDGFRDTWNIIGLNQPDAKIYIFDRYGKLLKQISAVGDGWDGTYNGENLPATDYWFTVTYKEIIGDTSITKEFKAHFSLLR